jgi:hypothetical protein
VQAGVNTNAHATNPASSITASSFNRIAQQRAPSLAARLLCG